MSSYKRETKHPITGEWQVADWLDDYFGRHRYGVKFKEDMFEADKYEWETRDNTPIEMPLPTETMEYRFKKKFPSLTGIKVTPRYDDDFRKAKLLQQYYNNLEKDLLAFIESELSLSQNRILEDLEGIVDRYNRATEIEENGKRYLKIALDKKLFGYLYLGVGGGCIIGGFIGLILNN